MRPANRRTVAEAYDGQLRLVGGRLDAYWRSRASELEANLGNNASGDFHRLVTGGAADSLILLSPDGSPLYPSVAMAVTDDGSRATAGSTDARIAQQTIRNFVRAGQARAAIAILTDRFLVGPASRGIDTDGRLIAADEQLLLISLLRPADPRHAEAISRLAALLNNYTTVRMPSPQRAFLMGELQAMDSVAPFPTLSAERLALAILEHERPVRSGGALRPTTADGVWQLASPGGRVVALFLTDTVQRAMRVVLDEPGSPGAAVVTLPPNAAGRLDAVAIGPTLPGWEIAFLQGAPSGLRASEPRGRAYLPVALLSIGAIAAIVATIGGTARRQLRLASLKTDLVSAVSHELKTPLASMRLLVDALLQDVPLDPVKARDYLQLMATENARLSRLIDNFLTFSRLERRRQRFAFTPTDPADVVRDAVMALPENRRVHGAPSIDVAPGLPAIVADQDALVTALLNLLDNAYKYTPADKRIAVSAFCEGSHVVFAVADNGIGIPTREQKRIFRRFYRVDQRLARDTAGSGLGLSIVDAIIRAHRGRVRVSSRPEHGSTFMMCVPCATEDVVP